MGLYMITQLYENGMIQPELQADLYRLLGQEIPVDFVFEQGIKVLGL